MVWVVVFVTVTESRLEQVQFLTPAKNKRSEDCHEFMVSLAYMSALLRERNPNLTVLSDTTFLRVTHYRPIWARCAVG